MESRIESENPKKAWKSKISGGNPNAKLQILQYDRSEIHIRTDLTHHNLTLANQTKIDNKSNQIKKINILFLMEGRFTIKTARKAY